MLLREVENEAYGGSDVTTWWYADGDKKMGPVEADGLLNLFQKGKISLSTLVWRDGLGEWQKLSGVDELKGFNAALPPPLPPAITCAKPWPRFFARIFDVWIALAMEASVLFGVILYSPAFADWIQTPSATLGLALLCVPIALVLDAGIYKVFGNTLGKALLKLRCETQAGNALTGAQYLTRNSALLVRGLGFGLPIVFLFTMVYQYNRLGKGLLASYDEATGSNIFSKPVGWVRRSIFGTAFLAFIIMGSVLNMAIKAFESAPRSKPVASERGVGTGDNAPVASGQDFSDSKLKPWERDWSTPDNAKDDFAKYDLSSYILPDKGLNFDFDSEGRPLVNFDVDGALKNGITKSEIAKYLCIHSKLDCAELKSRGYSDDAIIEKLAVKEAGNSTPSPDSVVIAIQQQLNRLGYEAGSEDGFMGAETRSAITTFQQDTGLTVDGKPSKNLLRKLKDARPRTALGTPPTSVIGRKLGERCSSSHECFGVLRCEKGVCITPPGGGSILPGRGLGERCSTTQDCFGLSRCAKGVCVSL